MNRTEHTLSKKKTSHTKYNEFGSLFTQLQDIYIFVSFFLRVSISRSTSLLYHHHLSRKKKKEKGKVKQSSLSKLLHVVNCYTTHTSFASIT